jgi:hypothetical protein
MAEPIALKSVSRLIRPAIVTGMMALLIAVANPPASNNSVVPLACTTTWTMVGRSIIFMPDCSHPSPPSAPPANGPPPGNPQLPPPN